MLEGLVAGLVSGAAYAILGVCAVVLFRLIGVLDFSQAAVGAFGAYLTYVLFGAGWPILAAAPVGIACSGLLACLLGMGMAAWFSESGIMTRSAVTIATLILLLAAGFRAFGNVSRTIPEVVPALTFDVAGVRISLGTLVSIGVAVAVAAAVTLFLRRTKTGLQLRAVAERPTTAELLGINARSLSIIVWLVVGCLSCMAILLVAPTQSPTFMTLSFLIVPAMAAGLVGGFSSVWLAIAGGLGIGALEGIGSRMEAVADYRAAIPFLVIVVLLVWVRRKEVWDEAR
ncbi:branched-chain amino acid ABC transporter permease [Arthrobacter mobilis]|uniref:Branched-chain amino acid ABC transporter permease n=1 Tax=Arthrobacter mobilis TaxID=2724944 RepID=A0A7X6K4E2_9MICC|nr:branched-chain amino acid ABC transporter permease [Arthrobacter mobilis]NKX53124.1 branched-chain amino acid ABC transporter permease [Arthrobacter mobilis]